MPIVATDRLARRHRRVCADPAANSADDEIMRLLHADDRPTDVRVATSDRTLAERVRARGACVYPAEKLRDLIDPRDALGPPVGRAAEDGEAPDRGRSPPPLRDARPWPNGDVRHVAEFAVRNANATAERRSTTSAGNANGTPRLRATSQPWTT